MTTGLGRRRQIESSLEVSVFMTTQLEVGNALVIRAAWEAEAEESLEPGRWRLQ